jgi:hypothetical protein
VRRWSGAASGWTRCAALSINPAQQVQRIVMALQSQDLARQKVEHLELAVREMTRHFDQAWQPGCEAGERAECLHYLAGAARVQRGQAQAVFAQMQSAAEAVRDGGVGLERICSGAVAASAQAGAAALRGDALETSVSSLADVLAMVRSALDMAPGIHRSLAGLRDRLRDCTAQVLSLALELRLAALNGQIFAAQVPDGKVLDVLAAEARSVTDDAMDRLGGISQWIDGTVSRLDNASSALAAFTGRVADEQKALAPASRGLAEDLRRLDGRVRNGMAAMSEAGAELTALLHSGLHHPRFPARAEALAPRALGAFAGLLTACGEAVEQEGASAEPAAEAALDQLRQHYTMAHEHEVHQLALGGGEKLGAAIPEPAPDDDGIELF